MKTLWTEKYRPNSLTGYVLRDDEQKRQVESWIENKSIPHLLFSGNPGTGKTTLAKILINQLNVDEYDVLEINASQSNSVDDIRNKIINFVSTMPFGDFKIVLLDEADGLSPMAQNILRGVMETYADSSRFILTCNYRNKIIPAIQSRCQGFHIEKLDKIEYTARAAEVLIDENITFDIDTLDTYVNAVYPDLRKCLNLLQQNSLDGRLKNVKNDEIGDSTQDVMLRAVELFKQRNFHSAREVICSNIPVAEIEGLYKWMYSNLDLWGNTNEEKDKAILIIRKGMVNHPLSADPEINLSATIVELSTI